ncbi:hypothetical protein [Natronobacterium gregoryi]|uniref:Uncharacterized protein n=2 Tax=Natronobacterium gregoryi TaxID=44930 RepID=L0AEC5_NATGS|nr:hypothetical protein [Natronobacterium gregoryi]AFZ71415.1 hypothetical protein Natgr_0151 [Natronobacterium gregoryi SP2]ELY66941.1 hypothetical protein C490_11913 [Natronobacterium gregoryi SP2]PLK21204.1 hypothetical protein CYV19_05135 [Natronobacterium gregoryi SP2]SFI84325.1 hypothetical protein SAMN05443661_10718 [Natronobacterium gregoryi]
MSTDADPGDRDRAAELESAAAGQVGIPVDAICVGCGQIRVKRADPDEIGQESTVDPMDLEAENCASFKHVCHRCGSTTWWNPVVILTGLLERERGE